jgi:hypothetical protein
MLPIRLGKSPDFCVRKAFPDRKIREMSGGSLSRLDLWCYVEGGDRGPAKKECATACAKAGNPIGVLDAKGNLYVAAGLKDHQPARSVLLDKMSQVVTLSGTVVKKGGVQRSVCS